MLPGDWGGARETDVRAVVMDAAGQVERELRCPFDGEIELVNLAEDQGPITFYRDGGAGPYRVGVCVRGRRWNQLAYQFAHEFCHVLSGYERLRDNPNNWFHEALCELASLFVLRRAGQRWLSAPPFPNWVSYAANLSVYADRRAREWSTAAPTPACFAAWLAVNEQPMRRDPCVRDRNGVVALKLLPVFEEQPAGWNAVRRLPAANGCIREYIGQWRGAVEDVDRAFVERLEHALFVRSRG